MSEPSTSPPTTSIITRDELLELVKAIQFAKPEASQRKVHREITDELSQNEGYQFLQHVQFKEVQKVWKQATEGGGNPTITTTNASTTTNTTTMTTNTETNTNTNATTATATNNHDDLIQKLQSQAQPPQLFTIGQNNSIQFLAQQYTASQLAANEAIHDSQSIIHKDYVHVFLDVPHDKSGSKPHQALIHFQKQKPSSKSESNKGGNNKKKSNKKSNKVVSLLDDQSRMIVKIQRAAPLNETDTTSHPMLLYNQTRTHKTFIHPDEGYDRLLEWMLKEGQMGALGATGGSKAFFYARLTSQKGHPDILSIDVTQLAPSQDW